MNIDKEHKGSLYSQSKWELAYIYIYIYETEIKSEKLPYIYIYIYTHTHSVFDEREYVQSVKVLVA